jgi:hypothetical protein
MIQPARGAIAAVGSLLILAGGCAHRPTPDEIFRGQISLLESGKTNEADLLLRFGAPTGRFEAERILTWRLGRLPDGEIKPATRVVVLVPSSAAGPSLRWDADLYDLVVVFDDHHLLKRFKLIPTIRNNS